MKCLAVVQHAVHQGKFGGILLVSAGVMTMCRASNEVPLSRDVRRPPRHRTTSRGRRSPRKRYRDCGAITCAVVPAMGIFLMVVPPSCESQLSRVFDREDEVVRSWGSTAALSRQSGCSPLGSRLSRGRTSHQCPAGPCIGPLGRRLWGCPGFEVVAGEAHSTVGLICVWHSRLVQVRSRFEAQVGAVDHCTSAAVNPKVGP